MSQNEEGTMCLPTPGLNIFLGAAVVVKRLPSYVKSVTRSMTSLPQVMPPMFSGYRFLISLILDAFTLSQTMVACFRSPSHVCDLLAQQNPRLSASAARRTGSWSCCHQRLVGLPIHGVDAWLLRELAVCLVSGRASS